MNPARASLSGKIALVTGGARGLGKTICEALCGAGAIVGGMRNPFLPERFPDIDPDVLQDPESVAEAVVHVLALPAGSVAGEISVLPIRETS